MSDDSFIREVDEELRSDRMKSIWKRFGKYIIAFAVLVVAGTAGVRGYEYWQQTQASRSGDAFLAALNLAREGRQDEALAALRELEKSGYGSYAALARMRAATVLADTGEYEAAIADFSTIGVFIKPGRIALTRMCSGACSAAVVRVRWLSAALVA